jgi:hypothetical protein
MSNGILRNRILIAAAISILACLPDAGAIDVDPVAEAKRLEAGFARLCGLWEWTVHSHSLNHREAKTKIALPTPEAVGIEGLSPTEIRIYGDAVYFRWNHPGGVQEDSMLLIDNKRLEGTFRTSNGAVGAVNGKRLSSCRSADGKSQPGGAETKP